MKISNLLVLLGTIGLASLPVSVQALQNDPVRQISSGKVLLISSSQIVIEEDNSEVTRTQTTRIYENSNSNLAPGATPAKDPNANLKDTTGNPHDTMIGKEIIDKHNATGISDGDNAEESRKRQTISKTITTTVLTSSMGHPTQPF